MTKKKKRIYTIIVALLILFIGGVVFLDEIVKSTINTVAPEITQTKVSVSSVGISAFTGNFTVSGVNIANPKGFSDASVFELNKVKVDVQMPTILKDVVVIDKIEVDGAEFFYELRKGTSNVSTLMNNINQFLKNSNNEDNNNKDIVVDNGSAEKKVFVKEFTFTNGKISIGAGFTKEAKSITLNIPKLTLRNIGSEEKGVAIAEVVAQGIAAFSASAIKVVASDGAKSLIKSGSGFVDSLKGLFE